MAQLSGDDPLSRDKALTQLHAGIDRATRLVDQLLTLSRLDSLNNLQDVAEISLEELLQSAVMDIYHPAQQANIDVRLQLNAHDVIRTGQPLLLSLLVRNLLDNAIRYSPQGSVVDVTLHARSFTVRDNGSCSARDSDAYRRAFLPPAWPKCDRQRSGIINRPSHRYAARHDGVVWQRRGRWI